MDSKFKGLILDMDGVFAQTEPIHFEAFRRIFKPLDIDLTNQYLCGLVGDPTVKNINDISSDFNIALDIDAFEQRLESTYLKLLRETPFGATPGLWDLVDMIKKRHWKLALCTSSTRKQAVQLIAKVFEYDKPLLDRSALFDAVVTHEDVKNKKPHPEPYLTAASRLGLNPHCCIAIEDSRSGAQSARTAGCYTVVLRNFYNRQSFPTAHRTIRAFSDLTHGSKRLL